MYTFTTAVHTRPLSATHVCSARLVPYVRRSVGAIYMGAGLYLFGAWLRQSDAAMASRPSLAVVLGVWLTACSCQPVNDSVSRGQAAIGKDDCGSGHTIRGIPEARRLVGPPLTGIRNRVFVAAMLENNSGNLAFWMREPKSVNRHTAMLNLGITPQEPADISNFLYSE